MDNRQDISQRRKTPQENKVLDYVHQRKNSYGENHKASIQSIRLKKRKINQQQRRTAHQQLSQLTQLDKHTEEDIINFNLNIPKKTWKKSADGLFLVKLSARQNRHERMNESFINSLRKQALQRLWKKKIPI